MDQRLPEGWVLAKVSDIADVIQPGFPHGRYNTEGIGIPHLRPMNIDEQGRLSLDEIKYVNVDNPPLLHSGDILFNNTNSPVWVGKTTIITQDEQYTFSNHMTRLTLNPHAGSPQFFAWQLQYMQQSRYFLERCVHHVNQASIASSYLAKNVDISVSPAPEQHRIVAAIEQQFTRLDSAVASLQSAKMRVKQYRASLLKAAVEGELTKEWRAEHPAEETGAQLLARILDERRALWEEEQLAKMREKGITPKDDKWKQAYEEPQGPGVEQLPEVPEGWCWATVEQIGDATEQVVLTGPFGSTLGRNDFRKEGIPLLTIGCLTEQGLSLEKAFYISEGKASELERYKVRTGDILFSRMASVGRADLVSKELEGSVINYHLMRLRLSDTAIDTLYFISFIRGAKTVTDYIREVNHGVTRDGINTTQLLNLPIAVPPLAEQAQIVSEVEARLSNIAKLEEATENNLKRAEHERQSILREAFAGRLVPQDPEDEPASVLLERIRAERKQREEAEKIVKVNRKGAQMEIAKRRRAWKASLYTTLVEARRPLPPDDLFKRVGLKVDEQPESVEVFYEELHADVEDALIAETRLDDAYVLLEALEPSAEVLARMAEAEAARQAQEAEQSGETVDAPTLWNM